MKNIQDFENQIISGNCLDLIKKVPDNSINLIITSPPYFNQREYTKDKDEIGNEENLEEYIDKLLNLFHECVRVIKDNGNIIFNIGDKYQNSNLTLVPFKFAIEVLKREPVKLVNNVTWVKLNPTPRQFRKRLVSSTEPFFHFVKNDNYYYNLDDFLNFYDLVKTKKNGSGNNIGRKYFDLIENSSLSLKEKTQAKEELIKVIEEAKKGLIEGFRMKIRGLHSMPFGGQEGGRKSQIINKGFTIIKIHGNSIKRDVIESPVETIKGIKHPAIYPEFIISEFIKLLTKKEEIVLDPFMGSGTTALACKKLKRKYIGFEINSEYCKQAKQRLNIKKENELITEWFL